MKPTLISIIVEGHHAGADHDYHLAVGQAVHQLGWVHVVLAPVSWSGAPLSSTWQPVLAASDFSQLRGQPWAQAWGVWHLSGSLARALRNLTGASRSPFIIFLESFSRIHVLAVTLALWSLPRGQHHIWLLYRGLQDLEGNARQRWVHLMVLRLLRQHFGPTHVRLLTDSDLVGQSVQTALGQPVTTLPIPHTEVLPSTTDPNPPYICWWPGSPRPEKGLAVMCNLACQPHPLAGQFEIYAAASAELPQVTGGPTIRTVADHLNRQEYLQLLARSHFIFLPYDPVAYRQRTSGIFTEAIIAGKIPIVTAESWMAYKLSKYHLQPLIIENWSKIDLWTTLNHLVHSPTILANLAKLQADFGRIHNHLSYAQVLHHLWKNSLQLPPLT